MLFLLGFCPVVLFSLLKLDKMTLVAPPWGQLTRCMMQSSSLRICIKHCHLPGELLYTSHLLPLYVSYYDYSLFTFGETEAAVKYLA